jgi:hypothetical protein
MFRERIWFKQPSENRCLKTLKQRKGAVDGVLALLDRIDPAKHWHDRPELITARDANIHTYTRWHQLESLLLGHESWGFNWAICVADKDQPCNKCKHDETDNRLGRDRERI